jgi:hypothetical protein
MAALTLAPGETNVGRIVQVTRQLVEGRTNAIGTCTLVTGGGGSGSPTAIATLSVLSGGSGFVNGSNVPVSGGTGTGAFVNITVDGSGTVISATVASSGGSGYTVGDNVLPGGYGGVVVLEVLTLAGGGGGGGLKTVVKAINCSDSSAVFLFPQTFNAAAMVPFMYVSPENVTPGQFIINHAGTSNNDCTFWFVCLG